MRQDFLLKEEEEEEHPTEEEVIFLLSQRPGPGQKIVEGERSLSVSSRVIA